MNKYIGWGLFGLAAIVTVAFLVFDDIKFYDDHSTQPLSREAWVEQELRLLPDPDTTGVDSLDMSSLHWATIETATQPQSFPLQVVTVRWGGVLLGDGLLLARDEAQRFYLVQVEIKGQKAIMFVCPNIYTSNQEDLVGGRVFRVYKKHVTSPPDTT